MRRLAKKIRNPVRRSRRHKRRLARTASAKLKGQRKVAIKAKPFQQRNKSRLRLWSRPCVPLRHGDFGMNWTIEPPTQPGTYWFRREPSSRDIMVQVRETNGELTVWWPDTDQPAAKLRASWRGPIPPSTGWGSR